MTRLADEQIREIAEELEIGMECFWHIETNELVFIPDFDSQGYTETEEWDDDIARVKNEEEKFIPIYKPESKHYFRFMVAFVDSLKDGSSIKNRLNDALEQKKPFAGFKNIIENAGDYRDKWFAFKAQAMIDWVKGKVESAVENYENPDEDQ